MSAGNLFSVRSIRLLAVLVLLLGAILSGTRSAHASCGDYLHTRFGPPAVSAELNSGDRVDPALSSAAAVLHSMRQQLAVTMLTVAVPRVTVPRVAGQSGSNSVLPEPGPAGCHGPECGRHRAPPLIPPVVPVPSRGSVEALPPVACWSMHRSDDFPCRSGSQRLPECVQPRPATPPPDHCNCADSCM